MTCTLASCVMPGTACGNTERTASGSRATCCHVRAAQPLRQLHSGRWHHGPAATAAAPVTISVRGMLQHSARRQSRLSARRLSGVVATMPDPTTPETEKERSPLDYPQVSHHAAQLCSGLTVALPCKDAELSERSNIRTQHRCGMEGPPDVHSGCAPRSGSRLSPAGGQTSSRSSTSSRRRCRSPCPATPSCQTRR